MKKQKRSMSLSLVQRFYPNVTHVKDATKDLDVEITNDINKLSTVKNHKKCAMAVACIRKQHADGAIIGLKSAYIIKDNTAIRYEVPPRVSREIISFDRNAGFALGDYYLKVPGIGRELGTHYTGRTHNKSSRKTRLHKVTRIRTDLRSKDLS